jgi:hypothetical protein
MLVVTTKKKGDMFLHFVKAFLITLKRPISKRFDPQNLHKKK